MTVNHSLLTTERKAVQQHSWHSQYTTLQSGKNDTDFFFFLLWSQVLSSLIIYDPAGQSEHRKSVSV